MEAARGNPLREKRDKADMYCTDIRVQGEPNRMTEDEAHEQRLQMQSLLVEVLQSPHKEYLMAELFPKIDNEHQ